ncbi:hypothetical protein BDK51DRAFT_25617 [Blyttiomyces helicus]|uniref:Uncharacterized protein n=1 Tax=Blyttiomyces helicus TaxID=388810 RepID=A0A4P9WR03_9FUNG|nr:hypothetical protein BDK51DRAFT_25617 [Blyttiomyces helicus]|eukprot:RKO94835.1 hypothetical protein BDK51DRAFT_25617 [Blyttiomyces helicus]
MTQVRNFCCSRPLPGDRDPGNQSVLNIERSRQAGRTRAASHKRGRSAMLRSETHTKSIGISPSKIVDRMGPMSHRLSWSQSTHFSVARKMGKQQHGAAEEVNASAGAGGFRLSRHMEPSFRDKNLSIKSARGTPSPTSIRPNAERDLAPSGTAKVVSTLELITRFKQTPSLGKFTLITSFKLASSLEFGHTATGIVVRAGRAADRMCFQWAKPDCFNSLIAEGHGLEWFEEVEVNDCLFDFHEIAHSFIRKPWPTLEEYYAAGVTVHCQKGLPTQPSVVPLKVALPLTKQAKIVGFFGVSEDLYDPLPMQPPWGIPVPSKHTGWERDVRLGRIRKMEQSAVCG